MGCCENTCSGKEISENKIKQCIQMGNASTLLSIYRLIVHKDKKFDINKILYKVDEALFVTPLGLALILGQGQMFMTILEDMNGDFLAMENQFEQANTSGIAIICLNNYLVLLQTYLPLYLSTKKIINSKTKPQSTLILDSQLMSSEPLAYSYTPIQLAVENGHISIVSFLINYTSSMVHAPQEIDLHYKEEITGNNCALIACKSNNYNMIKFLHSQCSADFSIINRFSENAINILAIGSQENKSETFKCLEYLIDKIGIDPFYKWKETLLTLEDDQSIFYMEQKLHSQEISVKKKDLIASGTQINYKRSLCNAYDGKILEKIKNNRQG
jgi:hypothetical protein